VPTDSTPDPFDELFQRIRQTLGELTPEPLLNRIRPVVEGFFESFQLVPQKDFQTHLRNLARLESTVSELEARIRKLEADRSEQDS